MVEGRLRQAVMKLAVEVVVASSVEKVENGQWEEEETGLVTEENAPVEEVDVMSGLEGAANGLEVENAQLEE